MIFVNKSSSWVELSILTIRPSKFADFEAAQNRVYAEVVSELTAGRKESHWMWFVFPQLKWLGSSSMAQRYGLESLAEAKEYLEHPVLGSRLRECTRLMLSHVGQNLESILGDPDNLKFRSSMTLFHAAAPDEPLFRQALKEFCGGQPDVRTLNPLEK
jgi:uncharacterized protein (DUF1810 family)